MKNVNENKIAYIVNLCLFIFFLILLILSEGYYGGGDNLSHFKYARAAFNHPEFLLDHWAKPVFTLLSAPFAQFGFRGVQVFNLIIGFFTGIYCYLTARELKYPFPLLASVILFFIPIYSIIVISGMTEILFGLVVIISVYYFLRERFILSAVIISFLPMVRTEGIVIVPIFALILFLKKKYRYLPWLITGFVLYSVIGFFYFKDIFWLITKMPYRGATDLYGTGSFGYYFKAAHNIFGNTINVLIIIGMLAVLYDIIKRKEKASEELFLILLPFVIYFFAHVIMWWSGIGNSIGEHRYMAAICPVVAILSLKGLNVIVKLIPDKLNKKYVTYGIITAFMYFVVTQPFKISTLPVQLAVYQKVTKECANWIKTNHYDQRKIYLYDPDFIYYLNLDPFDEETCHELIYNNDNPGERIEPGALVLWDAHYSPNCGLTIDKMENSNDFKMLQKFKPEHPFKMFNRDYEVIIFERL